MNSWIWNPPAPAVWRRLILEALVIVILGALVGLSVNIGALSRFISGEQEMPARPTSGGVQGILPVPILLDELLEIEQSGILIVDARISEQYAEGHLPGAVSLPLSDISEALSTFVEQTDPGRTLVIYCNGYGCPDSYDLGEELIARGYSKVRVYEGGYPEWRDAGYPIEGSLQ